MKLRRLTAIFVAILFFTGGISCNKSNESSNEFRNSVKKSEYLQSKQEREQNNIDDKRDNYVHEGQEGSIDNYSQSQDPVINENIEHLEQNSELSIEKSNSKNNKGHKVSNELDFGISYSKEYGQGDRAKNQNNPVNKAQITDNSIEKHDSTDDELTNRVAQPSDSDENTEKHDYSEAITGASGAELPQDSDIHKLPDSLILMFEDEQFIDAGEEPASSSSGSQSASGALDLGLFEEKNPSPDNTEPQWAIESAAVSESSSPQKTGIEDVENQETMAKNQPDTDNGDTANVASGALQQPEKLVQTNYESSTQTTDYLRGKPGGIQQVIQFDTISAYPPSVSAGANVSLSASFFNITNEVISQQDYSMVAELFDKDNKLLTITNPVPGIIPLTPNQISSLTIVYRVPDTYREAIYYKLKFKYRGVTVNETDLNKFDVIPKISQTQKESVAISGTFNLSYTSKSNQGTPSNIPTELSAHRGENVLALTGNLVFDDSIPTMQNYQLAYKSEKVTSTAGFFYPTFSDLTLSGQQGEGFGIEFPVMEKSKLSLINIRTHRSDQSSGTYEQNLHGFRWGHASSEDKAWGFNYYTAKDDAGSVVSNSAAAKNTVWGFDLKTKPTRTSKFSLDYTISDYDSDTRDGIGSEKETAFKARLSSSKRRANYELTYTYAGAAFQAVGASVPADQKGYDFSSGYKVSPSVSMNLRLGRNTTNVSNDLSRNSLISNSHSLSVNLNKPKLPNVSFSLSNTSARNGYSNLNPTNYSNSALSLGLNQSFGPTNLTVNMSRTDYKDQTLLSHNSRSTSNSFSLNTKVFGDISVSSNFSMSKSTDLFDMSNTKSNVFGIGLNGNTANQRLSYSANLNQNTSRQTSLKSTSSSVNFRTSYQLVPDLWNVSYEVSFSNSSNDNGTSDSSSTNNLLSLDYMLTPSNALTIEYNSSSFSDRINSTGNSSDSSIGMRYLVKF